MWAGPCGSGAALEWEDSAAEALREDEMNWTVKPSSQQERNSSLYRKVLLSGALSSRCLILLVAGGCLAQWAPGGGSSLLLQRPSPSAGHRARTRANSLVFGSLLTSSYIKTMTLHTFENLMK